MFVLDYSGAGWSVVRGSSLPERNRLIKLYSLLLSCAGCAFVAEPNIIIRLSMPFS